MSYDVRVVDPETEETYLFDSKHRYIGGTYVLGGTREAWLNVTYNYGKYYHELWGYGLGGFHEWKVSEVMPKLVEGITALGTEKDDNYWAATPGNAGAALADLLAIMAQFPQGKVQVG